VYATLNTLLHDDEVAPARRMAWQLYEAGVDGLIVQDTGLLQGDLPPLPLVASTQMHNHTPERVAFLEQAGFQRAILARELDAGEIGAIRAALRESNSNSSCMALSVSATAPVLSELRAGWAQRKSRAVRAALPEGLHAGRCAGRGSGPGQPPAVVARPESVRSPAELLDAGIDSFKIEGRLKDKSYVRTWLRTIMRGSRFASQLFGYQFRGLHARSGKDVQPRLHQLFPARPRGEVGSPDTPKMVGEEVGRVKKVERGSFTIDTGLTLHAGDGLCFFASDEELRGTTVNGVNGRTVTPAKMEGIAPGR